MPQMRYSLLFIALIFCCAFSVMPTKTKRIFPDFFEIKTKYFKKYELAPGSWFISNDGKDRLFFVPYTDHTITTAILTRNPHLRKDLTELLAPEGIKFNNKTKAIKTGDIISSYGFKTGVSKSFAIKVYGTPNSRKVRSGIETLKWSFKMKEEESKHPGYHSYQLAPFVLDTLSFDIEMIFRNDQLETLIYYYEVP